MGVPAGVTPVCSRWGCLCFLLQLRAPAGGEGCWGIARQTWWGEQSPTALCGRAACTKALAL